MLHDITFRFESKTAMMQHNGRLANPLDEFAKRIKEVTGKRKKTDEDYQRIADLEWEGSLYLDAKGRVIVPTEWIEGLFIAAAKKKKLGTEAKIGIMCLQPALLEHDGPKTIPELKKHPDFRDVRVAIVPKSKSRVMRCRPIFHHWALTVTVTFDDEQISRDVIEELAVIGGEQIGLSDNRPKYGQYYVKSAKLQARKSA